MSGRSGSRNSCVTGNVATLARVRTGLRRQMPKARRGMSPQPGRLSVTQGSRLRAGADQEGQDLRLRRDDRGACGAGRHQTLSAATERPRCQIQGSCRRDRRRLPSLRRAVGPVRLGHRRVAQRGELVLQVPLQYARPEAVASRRERVGDLLVLRHRPPPTAALDVGLVASPPDATVQAALHPLQRRVARCLDYAEVDRLVEAEISGRSPARKASRIMSWLRGWPRSGHGSRFAPRVRPRAPRARP